MSLPRQTVPFRRPPAALRFHLALLLVVLAAAGATAQETVLAIEFSFSNPGARSMGFAGAFAALADDATAAYANPAGLVQLTRPEVSVEGRVWEYSTPYTEAGRLFGEPSGVGVDIHEGLRRVSSSRQVEGLSFLSFVYPRNRWSIALFRHQPANFEFFGQTNGILRGFPEGPPGATERFSEERSDVNLEIISHGAAVGVRVNDALSLGLALTHFEGDLLSVATQFRAITLFDPHPFRPRDVEFTSVLTMDGSDWAMSGGFLWKVSERWRLAGFYRDAPDFTLTGEVRSGPRGPAPDGTVLGGGRSGVSMPRIHGLGLAYRSVGGRVTAGLEWNRVEYATVLDSIDERSLPGSSAIDDGDEWRLGGEYVFLSATPVVAVRAGVWLDPDHSLRATDDQSAFIKALRPPGEDELHVAAGLGLALSRFQLDLGLDLSDLVDTASLSVVYSF